MSENVGKLQIVIKGGKPWGFRLKSYSENRSAVVIDYIEPGGKAEQNGSLKVGDHLLKINDVLCLSLADALQLIESAFRTLTVLVWRPSYCAQSNKNVNNSTPGMEIQSYSLPFSPLINKSNESLFQKFHDLKCNVAVSKPCENYNSNTSKSDDALSSMQHQFSSFAKASSKSVDSHPQKTLFHELYQKDFLNKNTNDFNVKSSCDKEFCNPLLSQSQQRANLQYICEQYPLSEVFMNHKSDLKLESLSSNSKKVSKSYQSEEDNIRSLDNMKHYKDMHCLPNKTNISGASECICCMYPKCHSSYKNCKMHSPPERDIAVSQREIIFHTVNNQCTNYEHKSEEEHKPDSLTSCKISDSHPLKKLNCSLYKNSLKIKEDGFKNSDLKIFKPVDLSVDPKPLSPKSYQRQHTKDGTVYPEQVSYANRYISSKYFKSNNENKSHGSNNKTAFQKISNEVIAEVPVECTLLINHSEQNELTVYGQKTSEKETMFEVCNQHSSSNTLKKSYQKHYLNENEHSLSLGVGDYVKFSNKASVLNIFSAESSKSDVDEDEELCLIEENAKNNYSCIALGYPSITPDLALPSPPLNDDNEIIPTNEPLPSPPSFSPVKEVTYENIEISKKPDEAIYANLEMLKIKCSLVNSATQTSSMQKSLDSDIDSQQLSKQSFSFVETEIFSNIIGPTFGNRFRSDYLQSFLQSQLDKHSSVLKESIQKSEGKYSVERHAVSLPLANAYFTTSEPKAKLLTRYMSSLKNRDGIGTELTNKKEELMTSINKKLGILRLEQIALNEEMRQNEELGCSLVKKLGKVAQHNEVEKFRTHVKELEKITNLMISLSGRLARAENALLVLPSDASSEEKNILEEKYSKLNKQYDEAKYLKSSIDRRSCQVSVFLRKYFTEEEFTDYDHFITMKAKLLMDYRELDEKIKLGEEQLDALKSSVNNQCFSKLIDNSHN